MFHAALFPASCALHGLARRWATALCCTSLLALLAPAPGASAQEGRPAWSPVRSSRPFGLSLIAEGCERSASFRTLVDRLRDTNLIVYVQPATELPGMMIGATELLGVNGDFRYLRVWIDIRASRNKIISLLAHELQHALEIGLAPEVVDRASLEALYARIGHVSADGYDTDVAAVVGATVLEELWAWRPGAATPPAAAVPTAHPQAAPPRPPL